jgi:predicted dehydrogenase
MHELEEVELTAVCDIDPDVCRQTAEKFEVQGFEEHTDLLDSGLVEMVIIATPHYDHPPIAIDAFERGIHVLSEKPIAVTVRAADDMIAAAKRTGLKFGVMYQMRTEPRYFTAKKLINAGLLGDIYRTNMVMGWFRSQAYYDSGTWRATWTGEGGGVLINQAPHFLDLFTWFGGLPSKITGGARTRLHDIEVEDEAFALLEYENGAHGYLYASVIEAPGAGLIELCGNRGKLVISNGDLRAWRVKNGVREFSDSAEDMWGSPETAEADIELPEAPTGHREITRNMAEAILYGTPLIAPGEEGLNAMEMINGMNLSGRTGKAVDVPVDRAAYENLMEELRRGSKAKTQVREQRVTDPNFKH